MNPDAKKDYLKWQNDNADFIRKKQSKILAKIQKAQKNVSFNMKAPYLIRNKVRQYQNPIEDMNL